jgi:hypothetical protein
MNSSSPIQVWVNALTKPNRASYEEIVNDPGASLGKGILWLAIAGFLGGLASGIFGLIFNGGMFSQFSRYFGDYGYAFERTGRGFLSVISSTFGGMIVGVIGALILTGIVQLVARALGGTGSFDKLFYGYAAFQAPLGLVTSVLGAIPFLGCIAPLLAIYGLVLMVIATQAAHQLDTGKAAIASLAPVIIVFILCCCVIAVIGGLTGAIFSSSGGGGNVQFDWNNLMP